MSGLQVYHLQEGKEKCQQIFDEDLEEHQPFPTLQQVLEVIDPHVGFNIEIKWTMQLKVISLLSRPHFSSNEFSRVLIHFLSHFKRLDALIPNIQFLMYHVNCEPLRNF